MKIVKTINTIEDFYNLYFLNIPPLPTIFYVDNKKYKIKNFDIDKNDKTIVKLINCDSYDEEIINLAELLGKEFVWKFKSYDYIYNFIELKDNIFFINLKKYDKYEFHGSNYWKVYLKADDDYFDFNIMKNITTFFFEIYNIYHVDLFDFGKKIILKHIKNFDDIIAF